MLRSERIYLQTWARSRLCKQSSVASFYLSRAEVITSLRTIRENLRIILSTSLTSPYVHFSLDLLPYQRCDPQGGDKIPRKGGPGISQSDLLVINKVRHALIW
jgi:hypothetical protein